MMKRTFVVLLIVFSSMVFAQGFEYPDEEGEISLEEIKQIYFLSPVISEINVSRSLVAPYNANTGTGIITETARFVLRGYWQEIDPDSHKLTRLGDRAYALVNGTLEWSIETKSDDGGIECNYITTVKSAGTKPISNLNQHNGVVLDTYDVKAVYVAQNLDGTSEWKLVGELAIPVTVTESIIVTKTSPRISPVCSGRKESFSAEREDVQILKFPFSFTQFNPDEPLHEGLSVFREGVKNERTGTVISGDPGFHVGPLLRTNQVTILGTDGAWGIHWSLDIPSATAHLTRDTDKDGLRDIEENEYGTDANNPDTDGDGLLDSWEVKGVFIEGENVLDLPTMGAHPLLQDVFLELDWMKDATHSHQAPNESIQLVVNAFARKNIRLHVDNGQWGGGNPIAHQPGAQWHQFSDISPEKHETYKEEDNAYLFDIKKKNFDKNRRGIFYYGLFVHEKDDSSGEVEMGGNFYVALSNNSGVMAKAGTLMHEFGHALQLGHGGRLTNRLQYDNANFKPNYRSVMSYFFQFRGVPHFNVTANQTMFQLDYSDEDLPDLFEQFLSEEMGLRSRNPRAQGHYSCRDAGHGTTPSDVVRNESADMIVRFTMDGSPVDWNCNGVIDGIVSLNINGNEEEIFHTQNGTLESFEGRSDWDKVVLKIGCPNYGLDPGFSSEDVLDVTNEGLWSCPEHAPLALSLAAKGAHVEHALPPDLPFDGEACDGEDNDHDGIIDDGCADDDEDGVVDDLDNCVSIANADQRESNGDFVGDACEASYRFTPRLVPSKQPVVQTPKQPQAKPEDDSYEEDFVPDEETINQLKQDFKEQTQTQQSLPCLGFFGVLSIVSVLLVYQRCKR